MTTSLDCLLRKAVRQSNRRCISTQKLLQAPKQLIWRFEIALPHSEGVPAHYREPVGGRRVPGAVPRQFRQPVILARLGHIRPPASDMLMPKASVHEDRFLPAGENDVWVARQVAAVKPV